MTIAEFHSTQHLSLQRGALLLPLDERTVDLDIADAEQHSFADRSRMRLSLIQY